jgi:enhancer of polycomb-like protein
LEVKFFSNASVDFSRRDLSRTVTLLEMIKRREKAKREQLHLTIEIYEKRYQARDFSGQLLAEYSSNAAKQTRYGRFAKNSTVPPLNSKLSFHRPAFAPIYANQYSASSSSAVPSGQGSSQWQVSSSAHYANSQYHHHHHAGSSSMKRERDADLGASGTATGSRKEKRQYKKRKHKIQREKQSHHHHYQPAASELTCQSYPWSLEAYQLFS